MKKSAEEQPDACETAYAIVRNIPKEYHAKHLRHFFSDFVESGRFQCFHYRHRPEIHIYGDMAKPTTSKEHSRFCCVVSFRNEEQRSAFIKQYHLQFWINDEGHEIPLKCFIFPLKSRGPSESGMPTNLDFRSLIELKPPSLMPHGNVGTPARYFLEQIRLCKLPPSVLAKLGIKAKRRRGKYGAVYLSYSGNQRDAVADGFAHCSVARMSEKDSEEERDLNLYTPVELYASERGAVSDDGRDDDNDDDDGQCEEWERHEALHDDVTEQERTKPRKYEEEQEVTWEKGGPGLVWYTDPLFWKELEEGKDSDWKWADDWDVDYSVYYDRKDGDLDAKQAVEMLEDQKLRSGDASLSVFKKKKGRKREQGQMVRPSSAIGFGQFEAHTRGIGSKIMKRYGWSPGAGLGAHSSGRPEAVSMELEEVGGAQSGNERKGLGYRGEKLQRTGFCKQSSHTIATKYDQQNGADDSDTMNKILRREESAFMKYR